MKAASSEEIKKELQQLPPKKVLELTLRLARFKKENKELLSYLLFEAGDPEGYVKSIQILIDEQFELLSGANVIATRITLRKVQRIIAKQIKYIGEKNAAAELQFYFARKVKEQEGDRYTQPLLDKLLGQQLIKMEKLVLTLDEELQYDYQRIIEQLRDDAIPAAKLKGRWWKRSR